MAYIIPPAVRVYAGDTTSFYGYTFKTGAVADDMSGWTFRAQWRRKDTDVEFLELIVDATQKNIGKVYVSASPATSTAMNGPGVWDLQGTSVLGVVETFVRGVTVLTKDVTRA